MEQLVIEVASTGSVKALHSDKFDLGFLGDKVITRQTEIMFSTRTQDWYLVYIRSHNPGDIVRNDILSGFSGYEEARTFEVDWINTCRLHSIAPCSEEGLAIGHWLRYGDMSIPFFMHGEIVVPVKDAPGQGTL